MKNFIFAVILLLLILSSLFIFPQKILAQGTFECGPPVTCPIRNVNCDPEYVPPAPEGSSCTPLGLECNRTYPCVTPTPTPTPIPGLSCTCRNTGLSCVVDTNNCGQSARANCTSYPNCSSCQCIDDCGGNGEPCCNGRCDPGLTCGLAGTCVGGTILRLRQEIFCDANDQPTEDPSSGKIYTAIGCIPVVNTQELTEFLLRWGAGIAGGIAILLIIYAGYLIMTSAGNPQRVQAGKELLTAAIMGLILLLFGVFILQVIGVKILGIPGFGG